MRFSLRCGPVGACALLLLLLGAGPALATFPGKNGRISFNQFIETDESVSVKLFTVSPFGTGLRPLSSFGPGVFAVFSDWSPDGERLALDTDASGSVQAWTINADGSGARQLTDGPGDVFDPAYSPDGRSLAVEGNFDGNGIYVIPSKLPPGKFVKPAQARRVTEAEPGGYDSEPQFSPDGRWIAFTRYSAECASGDVENCVTRVFRVRADGSRLQQLTAPELNASSPDYHPTGLWITFDTGDNFVAPDVGSIMVMHADGSHKRALARGDDDDYFNNPVFSPNGLRISFVRWEADGQTGGQIWTALATGHLARPLLGASSVNKPDWGSRR